ncbi:MAG: 50S ribosomal protein L10 [Acidobacteriota bacterium]
MNRAQKEIVVNKIKEKFSASKSVFFIDFKGLSVKKMSGMRRKFKENSSELKIVRNRLTKIALKNYYDDIIDTNVLRETTGLIFSYEDEVSPAKLLIDFKKDNKNLKIKGALIEGKFFNSEEVDAISNLPPRNLLKAQLFSYIIYPLNTFLQNLSSPLSIFGNQIKALLNKTKTEE